MALNWPTVIDNIFDNANLGKVVTDVGSGFALTVPMLMLLGLWADISVLPADRSGCLEQQIIGPKPEEVDKCSGKEASPAGGQVAKIVREKKELGDILVQWAAFADRQPPVVPTPGQHVAAATPKAPPAQLVSVTAPAPGAQAPPVETETAVVARLDDDNRYLYARRAVARLASELETINSQISTLAKATPIPAVLETRTRERRPLAALHDQLLSQKEVVDEEVERLKSLKNERDDARSLVKNVETFTNNMSAVLAFSIIFGVVLSQMGRLVFIRGLYDALLRRKPAPAPDSIVRMSDVTTDAAGDVKEKADDLVTDYYRYVEGCVNMIVPVVLFGFVFPFFVRSRLGGASNGFIVFFALAGLGLAAGLLTAGYLTYQDYRKELKKLEAAKP